MLKTTGKQNYRDLFMQIWRDIKKISVDFAKFITEIELFNEFHS